MIMVAHVPQCYRSYCQKYNTTPYCTCDDCEGRKTHTVTGFIPRNTTIPGVIKPEVKPTLASTASIPKSTSDNSSHHLQPLASTIK